MLSKYTLQTAFSAILPTGMVNTGTRPLPSYLSKISQLQFQITEVIW